MRVVRGDEHDGGLLVEELEHLEAVQLRHLHVEEEDVGRELRDRLHRLEAVRALADDHDLGIALQLLPQRAARELLVVDDEGRHAHSGSVTSTRKVPPLERCDSEARSP